MTGIPLRLGAYAGALALAFTAAFTLGAAADPVVDQASSEQGDVTTHGTDHGAAETAKPAEDATNALPGLAVSAAGYTLVPRATAFRAGSAVPFRFTVTRPDGQALSSYRETHQKELHLIVVRRDLVGFQHVHPTRDAEGT